MIIDLIGYDPLKKGSKKVDQILPEVLHIIQQFTGQPFDPFNVDLFRIPPPPCPLSRKVLFLPVVAFGVYMRVCVCMIVHYTCHVPTTIEQKGILCYTYPCCRRLCRVKLALHGTRSFLQRGEIDLNSHY